MPPLPLGVVKNKVLEELAAWADQVSEECLVMDQLEAALTSRDPARLAAAIEATRTNLVEPILRQREASAGGGGGSGHGGGGSSSQLGAGGGIYQMGGGSNSGSISGGISGNSHSGFGGAGDGPGGSSHGGGGGGDGGGNSALGRSMSQVLRASARHPDHGVGVLAQRAEEALAEERILVACQGGSVSEIKRELHQAYLIGLGPGKDNRFVQMAEKILSLHQLSQNVKAAIADRRVDAVASMVPLGSPLHGGSRPTSGHHGGYPGGYDDGDAGGRQRAMGLGGHGHPRPGIVAVEKALRRVAIAESMIQAVDAHDVDALLQLQAEAKALGTMRGTTPDGMDANLQQQLEFAVKKERQRRDVAEWQRRKGEEGSFLMAEMSRLSVSPTKRSGAGTPKTSYR
eukprot:jgi/Mesvir1/6109/Mv00820-RA.1